MLIDDLIREGKFEDFLKEINESLEIDRNIEIVKSEIQPIGDELYDVNVKDKEYELSVKKFLLSNKKIFVEINFRLKNYKQLKQTGASNYGVETGITNTGDSKLVFDKIVSTIVVWIDKNNPEYITFQARERRRQSLYKLIIKQALRKIGKYKLIDISPITGDKYDESEFWLEKTQ